ncbi:MAG: MinD/ParA family protein [Pseudomonadota bacterium]
MLQTTTNTTPFNFVPLPHGGDGPNDSGVHKVIPISQSVEKEPRVIAITSGKGGVGKSFIAANMGICFAKLGRKVLMIDADLGLANLDLMLGIEARTTIREVLSNDVMITDAMMTGPSGVCLLPACSGDYEMAELDAISRLTLFNAIDSLERRFDTLVIDTGAGIGSNAIGFAAAAQQVVVVVTPDPASMADAYAMIKVLNSKCGVKKVYMVVNMAAGPKEADMITNRLMDLAGRFLDLSIVPIGYVYRDEIVQKTVNRCEPLLNVYPNAPVAASVRAAACRLLHEDPCSAAWGGPRLFWKRVMGLPEEEGE